MPETTPKPAHPAGSARTTVAAKPAFHFTREMMRGPIYQKYQKAINAVWNPHDLDYAQDAADWKRITEQQR